LILCVPINLLPKLYTFWFSFHFPDMKTRTSIAMHHTLLQLLRWMLFLNSENGHTYTGSPMGKNSFFFNLL
jgi:hypothetical protein